MSEPPASAGGKLSWFVNNGATFAIERRTFWFVTKRQPEGWTLNTGNRRIEYKL